jgi:DNA-directed RNA polymerase subunit RPC12/RpoP
MATATEQRPAGQHTADPESPFAALPTHRDDYRCECGHILRVSGSGRHRVYFEPTNTELDDPVMDRACPECGRRLLGKNAP